jgi:single-stranded DNA-binding protein
MNRCVFSGQIVGVPTFKWLEHQDAKYQAFLQFYILIGGPSQEGPSAARIVAYGELAESIYPEIREGRWMECVCRYRMREVRRSETRKRRYYEFVLLPHNFAFYSRFTQDEETPDEG